MAQDDVLAIRRVLDEVLNPAATDQVVIGAGHSDALFHINSGWPGARLCLGRGKDGADAALAEVLDYERIADRFEEVVVVSGDGYFADRISRLANEGIDVTVVAQAGRCSKRLQLAARRCLIIWTTATLGEAA